MADYDAAAIEAAAKQKLEEMAKADDDGLPTVTRAELAAMAPHAAMATVKDVTAGKAKIV
jgi:hypothetical protein